jgi:hypothetical protein
VGAEAQVFEGRSLIPHPIGFGLERLIEAMNSFIKTFVINGLSCAVICTMLPGAVLAQSATAGRPPAAVSPQSSATALLGKYMAQSPGSARGAVALEEVFVNGLPRTAQNSSALRSLLASKISTEEKLMVTRLLAKQYARTDPTGMNHLILQDLKALIGSEEMPLARAATLAYSRLGYFPDYQDVLRSAKDRGIIEDDTYFGELAHVFAFAPAIDQERLAQVLRSSKNDYASQVVAMTVNNAPVAKNLTAKSRSELAGYLEGMEPRFSMALGQFDFVEAIRFSAWLRAVANLKASEANKQGAEFIMAKLNEPTIDPRKVMAFLISEFGPELMAQIGQKARFDLMLQRISLYAKQHPQNGDMRDIVEQVRSTLSTLS